MLKQHFPQVQEARLEAKSEKKVVVMGGDLPRTIPTRRCERHGDLEVVRVEEENRTEEWIDSPEWKGGEFAPKNLFFFACPGSPPLSHIFPYIFFKGRKIGSEITLEDLMYSR